METEEESLFPTFGTGFLEHHAGRIISDSRIAVVELVANAWDAGASSVKISWPSQEGDTFKIEDDGIGMTCDEFRQRWMELSYNRLHQQGSKVEFPPKKRKSHRVAFGRNGIGRHAMFYFNDEYYLQTIKDGEYTKAKVIRNSGPTPYGIVVEENNKTDKTSGTIIYTQAQRLSLSSGDIEELIGSKFIADPEFVTQVNGKIITMTELEHLGTKMLHKVPDYGEIVIRRFDSERTGRTSKHHGIAWWVNNRLVGSPCWDGFDGPLLDARTSTAKRFTYIVEADVLTDLVKADWSGFHASSRFLNFQKIITTIIRDDLNILLGGLRRQRKKDSLLLNKDVIRELPKLSQEKIAEFAEMVQESSPTITSRDLNSAVEVLAKLEKSKSGYTLIAQLADLNSDDLDNLSIVLENWTINDAKKVLDELKYRMKLILQLEHLVDDNNADELHDLQPLFERGLWIFGPEFESISFTSNRTLSTIVKECFKGDSKLLDTPRKRPDFLILENSSLGIYSCDDFDDNHQICGLRTVFIIELKKGGYTVSDDEADQARKYARQLRRNGKLGNKTEIICYVLGSKVDPLAAMVSTDNPEEGPITRIILRDYSSVMRQAHARTFNLLRKVELLDEVQQTDADLREVLGDQQQLNLPS